MPDLQDHSRYSRESLSCPNIPFESCHPHIQNNDIAADPGAADAVIIEDTMMNNLRPPDPVLHRELCLQGLALAWFRVSDQRPGLLLLFLAQL